MATFRYPQNDLDSSSTLLNLLGSFWATTYQGNSFVEDLTQITGQVAKQTYFQLLEVVNSVSRFDIPVFHRKNWYALTFKESELNTSTDLLNKYGESNSYQSPAVISYNTLKTTNSYAVSKPTNLVDVSVILNRLTTPSVEYLKDIDFELTDNLIVFKTNPFSNAKVAKTDILNALGEIVDRECTLWLYQGEWDLEYVYEAFGYALNTKLQSSEGYKTFINAILDALVEGTSKRTQQLALASSFGIPIVVEASETVENIITTDVLNIITDSHVYQFPTTASPIVSVGDIVYAGDSLTDVFQIFELNRGQKLTAQELSALSVGKGILGAGYWHDLTFENADKDLIVQLNVDGYTKVSWDLGGFPLDVQKFWDDVHSNGVINNQTLAMLLDQRTAPDTQPLAGALPKTINPLQFLIDNFLRNNAFIVKLKAGVTFEDRFSYIPIEQIKKILPPHTVMILVVDLVYQDNPVTMEGIGSELNTGYEEALSGFPCMVVSEAIDTTKLSERIRTTKIGGRCI